MTVLHTSSEVMNRDHSWQFRVILASMPDTLGVIVRAVLAKSTAVGFAYGTTATIDKDGMVRSNRRDVDGMVHRNFPVGTSTAVRDEFRKLADHCKLTDQDREALFDELRKWIARDDRAISNLDISRHN